MEEFFSQKRLHVLYRGFEKELLGFMYKLNSEINEKLLTRVLNKIQYNTFLINSKTIVIFTNS